MPTYKQLSDAGDGLSVGQSASDPVGFHGTAPSAQRSGAAQAAVSASAAIAISSGYGFATAAQADAIVTLVNELRAALVAKGVIAGS